MKLAQTCLYPYWECPGKPRHGSESFEFILIPATNEAAVIETAAFFFKFIVQSNQRFCGE